MISRKLPLSTNSILPKLAADLSIGTMIERSGATASWSRSGTAATIVTITEKSILLMGTLGQWGRAGATVINRITIMNTHSILVHSRPDVSDTLIHPNYRETAPPTCQTTATIAGPTVIMYLIKMAQSFHAGSGMFDKVPSSAGTKKCNMSWKVLFIKLGENTLFSSVCTHTVCFVVNMFLFFLFFSFQASWMTLEM